MKLRGVLVAALGVVALLSSCGEQVQQQPSSTANNPCQNDFQTCVMPIFNGQIRRSGGAIVSCMDSNCHVSGGNGGRFTLGSNNDANYQAVKNLINLTNADDSLLLVEPTADSASPSAVAGTHGGGEIFPSRSDACYVKIRSWIANQVVDQSSPACGLCTPIANTFTSCGYP